MGSVSKITREVSYSLTMLCISAGYKQEVLLIQIIAGCFLIGQFDWSSEPALNHSVCQLPRHRRESRLRTHTEIHYIIICHNLAIGDLGKHAYLLSLYGKPNENYDQ